MSNAHRGYSCGSCDVVAPTRPALRKHIVDCHPPVPSAETGETKSCPSSGCDFTTNSRCEMETHVAAHVAQGMTPTGKKRTLALQRVRYRYLALVSITVLVVLLNIVLFKINQRILRQIVTLKDINIFDYGLIKKLANRQQYIKQYIVTIDSFCVYKFMRNI